MKLQIWKGSAIALCYLLVGFPKTLLCEVLANKMDPVCLASLKGLNPLFMTHPERSEEQELFSFYVTPYFMDGSSGWDSRRQRLITRNGNQVTVGIMEEYGPWNVAGLYYGLVDDHFIESGNSIAHSSENLLANSIAVNSATPTAHFTQISAAAYYSPAGYFSNLAGNQGVDGHLPVNSALLLGPDKNWTLGNFNYYYSGLLKSIYGTPIDSNTLQNLGLTTPASPQNASPAPTDYPTTNDNLVLYFDPSLTRFDAQNAIGQGGSPFVGLRSFTPEIKRYGFRSQVVIRPVDGIKFTARGGCCDLRVTPTPYFDLNSNGGTAPSGAPGAMNNALLPDGFLNPIAQELGLHLGTYTVQSFEDTYLELSAGQGYVLYDEDKIPTIGVTPSINVGVWLPTSKKYGAARGSKYAFYMPVGNQGHTGFEGSCSLTLDFFSTISLALGFGGTFFNSIHIDNYRLPNHPLQYGIYPFTVDVRHKLGKVLFAYASMRSGNFIDRYSFFIDYIIASHSCDEFTPRDTNSQRNALFEVGAKVHGERSGWTYHQVQAGFTAMASDQLELGVGATANVLGISVPRTRSLLAHARYIF